VLRQVKANTGVASRAPSPVKILRVLIAKVSLETQGFPPGKETSPKSDRLQISFPEP